MGGGPRRNIAIKFVTAKNTVVWLPDGEKKFDDTVSRFDRISACDGQADGRTDGHLATA